MSIRQQINKLITSKYKEYLTFAKNIKGSSNEEPNDVLNECLVYILENNDEKLKQIITYLDWYIIQMIKHSFHSSTSKYQIKYNKLKMDKNVSVENTYTEDKDEYDYEKDLQLDMIEKNMETLSWYEKEVFNRYVNMKGGFRAMAKQTGIPETSLYLTYKKAVKKIKNG